jgi:CheY-like chemotaxis protein
MNPPIPVFRLVQVDEPLDLFLVDNVMLPVMDAIELARRLRDVGYQHTPKLAISAWEQCVRCARNSGLFLTVLAKPCEHGPASGASRLM